MRPQTLVSIRLASTQKTRPRPYTMTFCLFLPFIIVFFFLGRVTSLSSKIERRPLKTNIVKDMGREELHSLRYDRKDDRHRLGAPFVLTGPVFGLAASPNKGVFSDSGLDLLPIVVPGCLCTSAISSAAERCA